VVGARSYKMSKPLSSAGARYFGGGAIFDLQK